MIEHCENCGEKGPHTPGQCGELPQVPVVPIPPIPAPTKTPGEYLQEAGKAMADATRGIDTGVKLPAAMTPMKPAGEPGQKVSQNYWAVNIEYHNDEDDQTLFFDNRQNAQTTYDIMAASIGMVIRSVELVESFVVSGLAAGKGKPKRTLFTP